MHKLILIFSVFVQVAIKAQTINTLYIDSTHITSDWPSPPLPCPSDTSFSISDGDTLYLINKLSNTMFNVWINDPDFTGSQTFSTGAILTNDTITRIAVINNATYYILGDNNIFLSSVSQLPNICLLNGTADFGRRYFFNHTVGIDELKNTNLIIYPSPAKNVLKIKGAVENETVFAVYDLSGKTLMTGFLTSNEIDIQELPSGNYMLNLIIDTKIKTYKFFKY